MTCSVFVESPSRHEDYNSSAMNAFTEDALMKRKLNAQEVCTPRSGQRRWQTAATLAQTLRHGSGSLHSSDGSLSNWEEDLEV